MKSAVKALTLILAGLIIFSPVVVLASDVTNAEYLTNIQVTNNGTSALTNQAVVWTLSTSDMITNGMLSATTDDLALLTGTGGSDIAVMPGWGTNPWVSWVSSIGENSNVSQYLYSKNVTGGRVRYFPNATGGTRIDTASMEPSANYSFKWNGIRFSNQSANLTDKASALNIGYNPTTGNVTFTSTELLTTYTEQDTGGFLAEVGDNVTYTAMTSQTDAYLYKIYTVGYFNAFDIRWNQYVTGDAVNPQGFAVLGVTNTLNEISGLAATDPWAGMVVETATDVTFRIGRGNLASQNSTGLLPYANQTVNLRLQRSAGSDIATYSMFTETGVPISSRTISGLGATTYRYIVIMNYNSGVAGRFITGSIANVRLNDPVLNVAVSSTADHDIDVTSNATTVGIQVDGGPWTTNATVTIPNTTSNWNFISNVPYVDNITMSVGGNPRLHYEPNTIITASTLSDRQTSDGTQDGTINWGGNPTGVDVAFGSLTSTQVLSANYTSSEFTGNFMPGNVTAPQSPTLVQANLAVQSDPLFPFVEPFADASNTPDVFFYWFGTIIISLVCFILGYRTKHLAIAAVAFDVPWAYGIVKDYIPEWFIIVLVIWTIGAIVAESKM